MWLLRLLLRRLYITCIHSAEGAQTAEGGSKLAYVNVAFFQHLTWIKAWQSGLWMKSWSFPQNVSIEACIKSTRQLCLQIGIQEVISIKWANMCEMLTPHSWASLFKRGGRLGASTVSEHLSKHGWFPEEIKRRENYLLFAWKDILMKLSPGYQERRPYRVQNHLQPLLLTGTTVKTVIFHPFYISFYCNPWQLLKGGELDLEAQEFNLYYSCYFCVDF